MLSHTDTSSHRQSSTGNKHTLSARQSGEETEEENNEAQGKDLPKRIILMGEGKRERKGLRMRPSLLGAQHRQLNRRESPVITLRLKRSATWQIELFFDAFFHHRSCCCQRRTKTLDSSSGSSKSGKEKKGKTQSAALLLGRERESTS